MLEEAQRARANPAAEGERIAALPDVAGALEQFHIDPQEIIAEFAAYPPARRRSRSTRLLEAARFHAEDLAENGFQQHDGSAGETFVDRIEAAGYEFGFISENVFAYAKSIPYCHAAFLIDWGNPDLGHRKAVLDLDQRKRDTGMAVVEQPAHPAVARSS